MPKPQDQQTRITVSNIFLHASDLARTSRGGLFNACTEFDSHDLYMPCRGVLRFLEKQVGYEIWSNWGEKPHPDHPNKMSYADALLEASAIALDHWPEFVDSIRLDSEELRSLRREVRRLGAIVELLPFENGDLLSLYTGVFS